MEQRIQIENFFLNETPISELLLACIADNNDYIQFIEKITDYLTRREDAENG